MAYMKKKKKNVAAWMVNDRGKKKGRVEKELVKIDRTATVVKILQGGRRAQDVGTKRVKHSCFGRT